MSMRDQDLETVEIERTSKGMAAMFIENASYTSLLLTFLVFAVFQSAYVYTGMRSPSLINSTTVSYPLTQEYSNRAATAKIRLEPVTKMHKFLKMDAILIRYSTNKPWTDVIEMNKTIDFIKAGAVTSTISSLTSAENYSYAAGSNISTSISVLEMPAGDFDALEIAIEFKTDFHATKEFRFTYSFADPNMERFRRSIRFILTGCGIYAFVGFMLCLKKGMYSNMQYLSVILGVAVSMAMNPMGLIFPNSFIESCSPIMIASFIGIFRFFVFFLIDTSIHNSDKMSMKWIIIYGPFIICFWVLESYVGMTEKSVVGLDVPTNLTVPGLALIAMHCVYAVVVMSLLLYSFTMTVDLQHFKVTGFGVFIITTILMSMITEVFVEFMGIGRNSSLPLLLYQSSHVLSAIVFLFFQHSTTVGYEAIDMMQESRDTLTVDVEEEEEDYDEE